MSEMLKVKAANPLVRVPLMDFTGYVEGGAVVQVPDHAYYRRAVADGDLVLVVDATVDAVVAKTSKVKGE